MFLVQLIFILYLCLKSATSQACDTSSNTTQCSKGEICYANGCQTALSCDDSTDSCTAAFLLTCKSEYCQPRWCTSTGQCVHGHVCEHYTNSFRSCVYPILLEANKGSTVTLNIVEPLTPGTYEGIIWYKDQRIWNTIADTSRSPFLPGKWLGSTNHNVKVNTTTGDLTILDVTIEDEGFYYYEFRNTSEGTSDTGLKYEYRLKLNDAPTGKPVIQASTMGQYKGEQVTLTCENPEAAGNPPCNTYDWIKQEANINFTPETQIYTFIMDEFHAGNYSCRCGNVFGESLVSDQVEILYLGERPENSSKVAEGTIKVGLIAGCVIGVLVLVVLVAVALFVCKKYNIKWIIQTKKRDQGANVAGGNDNHVYAIPMHDIEPTNTDNYNEEYLEPVIRPSECRELPNIPDECRVPPNRPEIPNEMPRHYVTPLNTDDREEHLEPVNRPDEYLEPVNRPQSEIYSEIPNEMPIQDVTPLNTDNNNEYLKPVNRPDEYLEPVNRRDEYLEPENRPKSENYIYDYINEDDMERQQVGLVNTAFSA